MTLLQGIKLANLAKQKGIATEAFAGKVRFTLVTYDTSGASTVTPVSEWFNFDDAEEFIKAYK
jgi:hypothetical protein